MGPYVKLQEKYKKGLKLIKLSCEVLFNGIFENLDWDRQTKFLTNMQTGELSKLILDKSNDENDQFWEAGFDREFFNLIRSHTMQGYYGSPRHGGNYRFVSYRMVGFDPLPILGQNRYKYNENEK